MNRSSVAGIVSAIVRTDFRRLFRDRTSLFFVLVLPVLIILIIGISIGSDDERLVVGVTRPDGPLASALIDRVGQRADLVDFRDEDALREAVADGEVMGGIVVADSYDDDVAAGGTAHVRTVSDPGGEFAAQVVTLVRAAVTAEDAVLFAARFAVDAGVPFEAALVEARAAADPSTSSGVVTEVVGSDAEQQAEAESGLPEGFGYTAPSNLVLFTFITSLAAAAAIVRKRQDGILRRTLAAPVGPAVLVLGLATSQFVLALFQSVFVLVAGALVFGVDWGDPAGAAALVVSFALVGTGVGVLAGTVFRTPEQASSIGPPIGIALGMLGGCMWPLEIVGPTMRAIGHATPHAWAMDGFIDLIGRDRGLSAVLPSVAVLLAFAVVLIGLATWRLRRTIAA